MIGKLKGKIEELCEDYVLLDVLGVCYKVYCPMRTLLQLGKVGDACALYIEMHVRQDQIRLFGFLSDVEKRWFVLLQSVQGIGTRMSMGILSHITPADILNSLITQDSKIISQVSGIGTKIAGRIVAELKGKVLIQKELSSLNANQPTLSGSAPALSTVDAVSALVNLGYSRNRVMATIALVLEKEKNITDNSQIIRLALKEMSC
ncbi:Holliday junction branch migration protein RuvA [Candidatus Liberibacter sp.]|uniref:Holliday junction branch migration protein RuvA n=1 Tax=Candidatus Liberibacter sp. TaxID=34022 RepID=UPI0015F3CA20|nr:Holliday junction branch migration protein RuvA [Candidatus Liberibacter sp.]MBA5723558.1 Holliday junction branch migration protein RuvA [Candidatus Liberibacter sp.]